VGIEEAAGFGAVFRIDVAGALGLAARLEALAVRRGCGAVASVFGERLPELRVDQLGERQ